jgi:hypothetical protein
MTFQALFSSSLTFLVVFLGTRNLVLSVVGGIVAFIAIWVLSIVRPCKCSACLGERRHFEVFRTTYRRGEKCSARETRSVQKLGICPDCREIFCDGPGGDGAQNVFCKVCGSGFNDLGTFGVERITDCRASAGASSSDLLDFRRQR